MVHTDHAALAWLRSAKQLTGKLYRWQVILEQFDFEVEYRAGKNHKNVDALSRMPHPGGPDALEEAEEMPEMMVAEGEAAVGSTAWRFARGVKGLQQQEGEMAERLSSQDIPRIIESLRRSDEEGRRWSRHFAVVEFPQQACLVTDEELSFLLQWRGSQFDSCMGNMNVWKESADTESDEGWEAEEAEEDEDADILEAMAAVLEWQGVDEEEMVKQAQEDKD